MAPAAEAGARALLEGKLVVHPTDTLYALAARALDWGAVARLVAAKGRAAGRPLSVGVSSVEELERWARPSPAARRFVRNNLPGPYTVLLPPSNEARRDLPPEVAAGPTIGLRVPDHALARELARRAGPLVATSANRSGTAPVRRLAGVRATFGAAVAEYLDTPPRPSGHPSVVVDLRGSRPKEVPRQ